MKYARSITTFVVIATICLSSVIGLSATTKYQEPDLRQPQYPLKTARTLWTDSEIAQARENVARYPQAKKIKDEILKKANYWLDWKDEDLVQFITDSRVPRAFETGFDGCPKCGTELYRKFGQYGWTVDPKVPFKVKCPVDGSVYPSNDYETYYKSNFKIKKGWDTKYVDDGWGWTGPNGHKYWFVGFWDHQMWRNYVGPGVQALGRAYLLTGDKRYAHKAVVMLHRIAEVYPAMDYKPQSFFKDRDGDQRGKVLNAIWETDLVEQLSEGYDEVWNTIDQDKAAQKLFGQSGGQIRAFIEANFLENAIDAYYQTKIRGNFGMHQKALVYLGLVRQYGQQKKWFDGLLNYSGHAGHRLGLNYALYDYVYRDGLPEETSPGYNSFWVDEIAKYGDILARTGRDVFKMPKTKRMFDGLLDMVTVGSQSPSLGDSGNVWGNLVGVVPKTFQIAWRHYHDPRYAHWLAHFGDTGGAGFQSFESLLYPPIEADGKMPPAKTRLLAGYGIAFLNNPDDTISSTLYYGMRGDHGHFDRLDINPIFAGSPVLPDLGYPDEANHFVRGIFGWSQNTIAHNTVTVDAHRQMGNVPGTVKLFANGDFARVLDVDAPQTYAECSQYRRALVMVDVDSSHSYFVDFFNVTGGNEHDYSLHGPPGEFKMIGGKWSAPAPGTLAGKDVKWGEMYDDPVRGAKGYHGSYFGYTGSGFQYLFNVRRSKSSDWVAQYHHQKNKKAKVRVRVLAQPGQEILLCDAHVSPVKQPEILRYLIARRKGKNLTSHFISVIEPYDKQPLIKSVERQDWDGAEVVVVNRTDGKRDVIFYNPQGGERSSDSLKIKTDASVAVVTFDGDKAQRAFFAGGSFLDAAGEHLTGQSITGKVVATDPAKSIVRVKLDRSEAVNPRDLVGRVVYFVNDLRRTAHPIIAAERQGDELVLTTKDALLVGRARIIEVGPDSLHTDTPMHLDKIYTGTTMCTLDYQCPEEVHDVQYAQWVIHLTHALPQPNPYKVGDDVWLVDVGTVDSFEAPAVCSWQAKAD